MDNFTNKTRITPDFWGIPRTTLAAVRVLREKFLNSPLTHEGFTNFGKELGGSGVARGAPMTLTTNGRTTLGTDGGLRSTAAVSDEVCERGGAGGVRPP